MTRTVQRNSYPEDLIQIAPRGDADRQKIVSWLTRSGLGSGTAGNKAATYLLIGSETPNEPSLRGVHTVQKPARKNPAQQKRATLKANEQQGSNEATSNAPLSGVMPLNINVQIHISAEATGEQIDSIFSSMRRYLYDNTAA